MTVRTRNRSKSFPTQVTIAADPDGASVLLNCQVEYRADVGPDEGPIVAARNTHGDTHPAVERAMSWARETGYDVAVVIW